MARLNAKWFNFSLRGQAWDHFWHDAVEAGGAYVASLSAPSFAFTPQALVRFNDWMASLSAPVFNFTGRALAVGINFTAQLSAPLFKFSAYALDVVADIATVGKAVGGFIVNMGTLWRR